MIPNEAICLFKRYQGGIRDGLIVLVQHSSLQDPDFGSGFTVKEYHSKKQVGEDGWHHEKISLMPLSYDAKYEPIELEESELVWVVVVGVFQSVLGRSIGSHSYATNINL